MVTITVNGADFTVNATPADARSLAANLLDAASSAENDAFFVSYLREAEVDDTMIAEILLAFRQWKEHDNDTR
jgi:voltage-gated potassium channel Kch